MDKYKWTTRDELHYIRNMGTFSGPKNSNHDRAGRRTLLLRNYAATFNKRSFPKECSRKHIKITLNYYLKANGLKEI